MNKMPTLNGMFIKHVNYSLVHMLYADDTIDNLFK